MIDKHNPSCVALGNFDGIHIGHDILIRRMVELSHVNGLESIIITFKFIKKDLRKSSGNLKYINSANKKLESLKCYGADEVIEIELDEVVSKYSPEQFIKEILVDVYNAKYIVVGYNFTFGYKATGNVGTLQELGEKYGYQVEEIQPVKYNGIAVSSTLIRNLIKEGKIKEANKLLKSSYTINFEDVEIGYDKNIGFVDNKNAIVVPADGRYKVKVGEEEMTLKILTEKEGKILDFDRNIKEDSDIVFIG
jgi:riboflavin kinase/FMN adenylyltransferase